ncbi:MULTISPECIES: hypothetical protein [unclassified Bradyrhizobium]|jgi:hypothetical protein|uniref:hypothetical protein n=1 Tax=unclassified Bradyrhizobium TaxID=2631580 RepID=UPI001FFC22FF|nr:MULTISPECIES: hypothetical protein [unclassified Bradyrhizobium]
MSAATPRARHSSTASKPTEQISPANPEAGTAVDAVASFIETPGQTLVVKVTPRAKVPLMQLMQLFNADPEGTLAQFNIEASTGL